MATSDNSTSFLRLSDLFKRLILDIETTDEVGHVAQLLVNPATHQVEGVLCKTGLLGREHLRFGWRQIESIGRDSVIVRSGIAYEAHRLEDTQAMTGQEVWSEAGERVGRLVDYCFDRSTGHIQRYLFSPEGLRGWAEGLYSLDPASIISVGMKRIMVKEAAVAAPDLYEQGWSQKVADAAEALRSDAPAFQPDWQAARHQTEELTDQLQQQTRKVTDQARERFGQAMGQFKKRTRRFRHQFRESFTDMTANLPSSHRLEEDRSRQTIDVDSAEVWPDEEERSDDSR